MSKIKKNLNVSNSLSLSRIFLAIPMAYFLINDMSYWAVAMGFLAYFTDIGDGYFARKLNEVTELGKVIDPIADKIFVGVSVIILVLYDKLPLWFVLVVVGRDLLILLAGAYASRKVEIVIQSNYIGKAAVILIALTILFAILQVEEVLFYSMIVSCVSIAATIVSYGSNLIKILKNSKKKS